MNNNLNCSEHNPADYHGKKLMVFENESGGHLYRLSAFVSPDGKTFTLIRTAVGAASAKVGKENQVAVVEKSIDETTVQMMEKPNSRFLNNQCDLVLFLNSPRRKAQYTEPKPGVAATA
jgi:hypothetical protein